MKPAIEKKAAIDTTKNTVYISNLSYDRDRNGLKTLFVRFGEIKNIKIIVEPSTNQSRGMAFVEMGNAIEAKKAIQGLNQQIIDGRTVKATYATPLKKTSTSYARREEKVNSKVEIDFQTKQLTKKAKNIAKRKANPLVFKVASKNASK